MNKSQFYLNCFLTLNIFIKSYANILVSIDYQVSVRNFKTLRRFWTNTGFSPLGDVNILKSTDLNTNLEIIGSLPNNGLKNVRIHWLLDLLFIQGYENNLPIYGFKRLDEFLIKIINEYNLYPTIELMTSLKFKQLSRELWEDLTYRIVSHYIDKLGSSNIMKWKFETWNEPDLAEYNKLNFTLLEYGEYIKGVKAGLDRINTKYSMEKKLRLRGPAGLFRDYDKHKFCWNTLENCNQNISNCHIDIITFHRKGNGNSVNEIMHGSLDLLKEFSVRLPNLATMKYSNTEADPIKGWIEPRDFQADMRYASILIETVLEHWKAKYDGRMMRLESISHDNSFMNFYPNIFTQRTLLARFQYNNTVPKYTEFIRKPVFTALGMLSNLGQFAANVQTLSSNISYIISGNNDSENFFSCIIITSHVNNELYINRTGIYEFEIKNLPINSDLMHFIEFIDNKRTNPARIYEMMNNPIYPEANTIQMMKAAQGPVFVEEPSKVVDGKIFINIRLTEPFAVTIRICNRNLKKLKRVKNLRIRKVNKEEIILFWKDSFYHERCIRSYEIHFKAKNDKAFINIEKEKHLPFLYHQFKHTIPGCFKVRSRDFFNRVSKFSKEKCI